MPRSVALVFNADYSGELEKVAFHTPVWMADMPANRAAAEEAWRAAVEWPHISVTLFRPPEAHVRKDDWRSLLEQIALRERLDGIEVSGARLTPAARVALREAGFIRIAETPQGFRAKR